MRLGAGRSEDKTMATEAERYREPGTPVRDTELRLDGLIQGYIPVQAEGTVMGFPFYFRAKYGGWQFVVSLNPAVEAAALDEGRTTEGFFEADGYRGYILKGEYPYDEVHDTGSYMPYANVERVIRDCAARFVGEHRFE
jgi:hypothetical protein